MNSKKKKGSVTVQGPSRRTRGIAASVQDWEEQGPNLRISHLMTLCRVIWSGIPRSVGYPDAQVVDLC